MLYSTEVNGNPARMEAISDDSLSCDEANEDIGAAQDFLKAMQT